MIEKFSVSDSNTFKQCPRKFYYSKVAGWDVALVPKHLTLGINYDKMLEIYDTQGFDAAFGQIEGIFKNSHDSAEAEVLLGIYHNKFKDELLAPVALNDQPGNQHGFGVKVDGGPKITGYLDKLSQNDRGIVVVERKTTSEPIESG